MSEDKIAEYENVLGVRFPYDFRAFLGAMNGTDLPTLNIYGYRPEPPHTLVGVYSYPQDVELVKHLIEECHAAYYGRKGECYIENFPVSQERRSLIRNRSFSATCIAAVYYRAVYEVPFTKASVVVGIETVTSPVITRRAWKFLSLDRSGEVTS